MARTKGSRGWGHIRRLPSGNLQASYIGPDLRRHNAPVTYSNTKAGKVRAEGWLADERARIEADTWTPPKQRAAARTARAVSLADYAAKWISERKVKPRTRLMYESLLKHHIRDGIGASEITAVTPDAVRTWFAALGSEHTRRNSHVYGLLHAIMATAVKDGLVLVNPCQIERAMNVARKREPVILTVPELATLASTVPERLKALVLLSAWCGLRWGEVIELHRRDFENDCEVIFVRNAATHRGECRIDSPKSGKPRAVVIPPHIRADIKHHLDVFTEKGYGAVVFAPLRGGCHLNDKVFRDAIAKPLHDIKRADLRIHDLRHFAGTQTARVGNLTESMARLGHSTVKASLLYQQVVSGRDAEMAAALSELATAGK
ncbi:tyrosine-type recombinase/integrase [Mycobacterium sp.]|uniref:tyrosine-type recombinase/integrase n=1 Tax=Mycobacterium sp. TaxID=1785 RepID=UPI003F9B577B